jgi:hypothetical protein
MNIEIGDQGTACRYRGVIKVQIPIPPEQKTLTFNLIAPDGESIAIRQKLSDENRHWINHHIHHSFDGTAWIAFPENMVMQIWSVKNKIATDAMWQLLKLSIDDQEIFVQNLDKTIPLDTKFGVGECLSDDEILKRIDDEEKRIQDENLEEN